MLTLIKTEINEKWIFFSEVIKIQIIKKLKSIQKELFLKKKTLGQLQVKNLQIKMII